MNLVFKKDTECLLKDLNVGDVFTLNGIYTCLILDCSGFTELERNNSHLVLNLKSNTLVYHNSNAVVTKHGHELIIGEFDK